MCAGKDSVLAGGALVSDKNSYIHKKPTVSLQSGEEIITIMLFCALATILDNFEFSFILIQLTILQIVEVLGSEARCWRLKRK